MPTALIVEDEPEANKLLAMLVQLRGYRTDSALTGGEALDLIARNPPDIVFLDLMLPDLNGYEICASLKANKETALIPVVMVTARVATENRLQSFNAGADQYVPKPYTPDQIFDALDDANHWREALTSHARGGSLRLESRDEGETLRQISRLRSVLLARTPLNPEAVGRIAQVFQALAAEADAWGQIRGASEVARLDYETQADRVTFTLTDLAGWFRDDRRGPAERWVLALADNTFDEVAADRATGAVTFSRRYHRDSPPQA